jgi:hypothetical protein
MKSCTYFYKGKKIGNIKELDDFLLEKQRFESKLGDMVFELTTPQSDALVKLEVARKNEEELKKKYEEARRAARKAKRYGESEEAVLKMKRPYVGVSEFLNGQRNRDGKLYFPNFIPENFWSERYYDWAKGEFTEDEIKVFFDGDETKAVPIPLGNDKDWRDSSGNLKEDFGTDE